MADTKADYRAEAERLALLPPDDQAAVVELYADLAVNPLATPACRQQAREHAQALKRHLARLKKSQEKL